ncbi:hypothetical protein MPC4_90102 [Methylocella tundrae]|uniref:Uncharacterized protein n=1 Tax=Methylocella tundrae TaxID=227605 RepID=A0A8B6MC57_METTU|nr:hypothetical protein MPC1_2550006 [Methylocella tundrae]VTZ52627.1 hypothetical protein MPC4_90102 [Methylocella tundrae]
MVRKVHNPLVLPCAASPLPRLKSRGSRNILICGAGRVTIAARALISKTATQKFVKSDEARLDLIIARAALDGRAHLLYIDNQLYN